MKKWLKMANDDNEWMKKREKMIKIKWWKCGEQIMDDDNLLIGMNMK